MADFVQTMKDWQRMCAGIHCADCEIFDYCEGLPNADADKIQRIVTSWAAENPEPVYPTWEEWLVANGIMEPDNVRLNGNYRFYYNGKPVYNIPSPKMFDPIPADIAQKLGIQPKEV
jgi:hypothetical protein